MSQSNYKSSLLNLVMLLSFVLIAKVAFVIYVSYIVKFYAFHDVYYNQHLYVKGYHFLFLGFFSIGFFFLPFLHLLTRSIDHRKILRLCLILQGSGVIAFILAPSLLTLLISAAAMSLVNIVIILAVVQVSLISKRRHQLWALALIHAFGFTFALEIYQSLYPVNTNIQYILYGCVALILINFILLNLIQFGIYKNSKSKNILEYYFIGIFSIVKHSRTFLLHTVILVTMTCLYVYIEMLKLSSVYVNVTHMPNIAISLPISTIIIITLCYIDSNKLKLIFFAIFTVISISLSLIIIILIPEHIFNHNSFRGVLIADRALSLSLLSIWIAYIIRNFLEVFKKASVFSFSALYLICNVLIWLFGRLF
ncbi:hypothetical protein LO80_01710 [Candidatus Francisella endociliophora]|uniref:Uncharacterized protein n=1 Tax=Candidatus Francisella endociliophora TaxID=653937 RepID=A0A097EML9_9GAMM|nr:hypothetical protein [Francisella sp. FSC1006]AIT08817.1 hypothetical protein LO80_01710 [Francisella sp. FSC1006]